MDSGKSAFAKNKLKAFRKEYAYGNNFCKPWCRLYDSKYYGASNG
jgi:hypothetical protein